MEEHAVAATLNLVPEDGNLLSDKMNIVFAELFLISFEKN